VGILKRPGARRILPYAVVGAAALTAYANTLRNDFVYDDHPYIVSNVHVDGLRHVGEMFRSPFPPDKREQGLYRPVTTLSFAVDDALWGKMRPGGFHLTSALLHAAVAMLLVGLARLLLGSAIAAAACGLLYAVHPVLTEAVAALANRSEVLTGLFTLAAIRLARAGSSGAFVLALACFFAGLLSKENAVVMPALLLLVDRTLEGAWPSPRRLARRYVPFVAVGLVYLVARLGVLGTSGPEGAARWFHGASVGASISASVSVQGRWSLRRTRSRESPRRTRSARGGDGNAEIWIENSASGCES